MREFDPQGYQQMMQETTTNSIEADIQVADQMLQSGQIDIPFENVPPKENFEAQPQAEVQPQQPAQQQDFQAVAYGAPVAEETKKEEVVETPDPLAHIEPNNPWNTSENMEQLALFKEHRKRLNIEGDKELLPHVRDYFQDENATIASLTPEILREFNSYLTNIQA